MIAVMKLVYTYVRLQPRFELWTRFWCELTNYVLFDAYIKRPLRLIRINIMHTCIYVHLSFCSLYPGGQPYILTLWSGHRLKGSMIQMMHFVFSLGAAAGPLVTKPFLPDLSFIGENCTALATNFINSSLGQLRSQEISNASAPYCPDRTEVEDTVVTVRFAYVTVSLLLIIPITFFTIVLFLGRPSFRLPRRQKADRENQDETKPKEDVTAPKFRIRLLIGGFVLFLHYLPVESSPSNFLAVFAVKGLGWPNGHGSLIIFVSWAALGIGRGLSIPIIACLSPARMLMGLLGVTFVGAALLIFSPYHDTFVWVSAAVAGIGMGPFFATAYVWLSQYISITGRTSSIFVAASYLAGLANPYILGYLLDNHGHMALAYYEITVAASFLVTYIFLQIFVTRHSPKKSNANSEEHTDNGNELL